MIINLRATGGGGKSWVIRQVIQHFEGKVTDYNTPGSPYGHIIDGRIYVIGPYFTQNITEGADVINRFFTQDQIGQLIYRPGGGIDNLPSAFRDQGFIQNRITMSPCEHTLFEGLLVSGIYSRYAEMAKKAPDFRWIFLNTSLETCLENTSKT